ICHYTLLNAANYGVPQLRERLFLIAHHRTVGAVPTFPTATHRVEFPSGYTDLRLFALKHVDRQKSHYVSPPTPVGELPVAISVTAHLRARAPISRKKGRPRDDPPDRLITQTVGYAKPASAYGRAMREWDGFGTSGEVTAHVARHTPRDYRHFSAMAHGE